MEVATREREQRSGAWVEAALTARGLDDASVAVLTRRAPTTVYRWRMGGIDYLDWIGLLTLLALPPRWQPGDPVPPLPTGWTVVPGHAAARLVGLTRPSPSGPHQAQTACPSHALPRRT